MRHTFKKLNEFLSLHFKDEVELKNEYGIRTLSFGKLIERENRKPIRVFTINNAGGYALRETQKIGHFDIANDMFFRTLKELSEYIIENIDEFKKKNDKVGSIKDEMELIDDDKMKHLKNTLVILKLEGKFDDFYKTLSGPYIEYNHFGRTWFEFVGNSNSTEEDIINRFIREMKNIEKSYVHSLKRSFVKEYNIDLVELAEEVMELLYERRKLNLGETIKVCFVLKPEKEICKKFEEV